MDVHENTRMNRIETKESQEKISAVQYNINKVKINQSEEKLRQISANLMFAKMLFRV